MKILIFYVMLPIVYLIPHEFLTYLLHKHVMHGIGWGWHRSHHHNPGGGIEKNDLYAVVFAFVAIALFYTASYLYQSMWLTSYAIGLTLYGACYFFVHDFLIHRRVKNQLFRKIKHPYIQRLIRAHAIHHKIKDKENCQAFGFLYAPKKYAFPKQAPAGKQIHASY